MVDALTTDLWVYCWETNRCSLWRA